MCPPGTFLRRKQRGFTDADGWLAVMPARMAETEVAVVYVIHFLRCFPVHVNLTESFPLRFMPPSLAAIRTQLVQSLHKMNCYTYLKDEAHYIDLYDRQTVEECRAMERRFAEASAGTPADQHWQTLLVKAALYFLRGERYARKTDTIMFWRESDRQRDRQLAQARPPRGIRCVTCFSDMVSEEKDLHERDGGDQVLFFFICPKCDSRRAFYEDGTEYRRKKILCSQCQSEANVEHQRAGGEVSIITTCPECGKVEAESLAAEKTVTQDEHYAADRERFCMSEEEGREYDSYRISAGMFQREQEERELHEKRQNLYDEIAKLKRLTVVELENLLIPALERERFVRLDLGSPAIKRDVQMPFCVQDARSGRSDRDSIKNLERAIEEALDGTNWRLSSGITYHLGILNGQLRGLETEKDLLALVRMRLKRRISQK